MSKLAGAWHDCGVRDAVHCIAVSGSLGRMEQLPHSDCDLIVLLDDDLPLDSPAAASACNSVWQALPSVGLPAPKATGIYAAPSNRQTLLDESSLGTVAEDVSVFGKRIQLLLDCQPLYGRQVFNDVVNGVVDRYLGGVRFAGDVPGKYLLDDLLRYFRSLSVNYRWEDRNQPGRWRLRNVKLRHNRLINFAGLLFVMAECSRDKTRFATNLKQTLTLTPLERIAWTHAKNRSSQFEYVASCYETYLESMADREFYHTLLDDDDSADRSATENESFAALSGNAVRLRQELRRFLFQQDGVWSDEFLDAFFF